MKRIGFFLTFSFIFLSVEAEARPEYALQIKSNRCTTCHSSPTGGGHRNITGKAFGPKAGPLLSFSQQDLFGLDWRSLAYTPLKTKELTENLKTDKNGLFIMAVLPSVSIPFLKNDKGMEWRFVHSHNLGGGGAAGLASFRDSYLRVKLFDDYRLLPQIITVGRFSAPFGILSDDEHRTYIRQQTKTTWNDREIGVLFSGDVSYRLHYDIAFVNGEQIAGTAISGGQLLKWGGYLNLRYMALFGWMAGVSAHYYNNEQNSSALSAYQVLSLGNITKNILPGVFTAEAVLGYKTNHRLGSTNFSFFSDPDYQEQVKESNSLGILARWDYNFSPAWRLIVKYDHLTPDLEHWGDRYQRLGTGVKYFFNNQVSLDLRYEKAWATPLSEEAVDSPALSIQDIAWLLLQVKI